MPATVQRTVRLSLTSGESNPAMTTSACRTRARFLTSGCEPAFDSQSCSRECRKSVVCQAPWKGIAVGPIIILLDDDEYPFYSLDSAVIGIKVPTFSCGRALWQ